MSSVEWECGYCGKMIDPEKICAQDAAPPQADAEALLHATPEEQRALHRALLRSTKRVEHPAEALLRELVEAWQMGSDMVTAIRNARAYLAAKDAPSCDHAWNYITGTRRRRCTKCSITKDAP